MKTSDTDEAIRKWLSDNGRKGGNRRAATMKPKARKAQAQKAVNARWDRHRYCEGSPSRKHVSFKQPLAPECIYCGKKLTKYTQRGKMPVVKKTAGKAAKSGVPVS